MPITQRRFDVAALKVLIGGESVLDIPYFKVQDRNQALDFMLGYGYDLTDEGQVRQIWDIHKRAVTYLLEEILLPEEELPKEIVEAQLLEDPLNLLLLASTQGHRLQKWSCALLKVMHVFVHLENDLFAQFQSEIQRQILKPIENEINEDPLLGTTLGPTMGKSSILLKKFEVKSFKTMHSAVTKLLCKREIVAFNILDKIGVRIVTKRLIDVFRVLSYFLDQHMVSFPHNVAEQTNNTVYPLKLFLKVRESLNLNQEYTEEELDQLLHKRYAEEGKDYPFRTKKSEFSSQDYRFLKFINRRLIRLKTDENSGKVISFFYPFEVQIVDYETHLKNMVGEASHEKYKERQAARARARLFGFNSSEEKLN